jgi:hypothetical protein
VFWLAVFSGEEDLMQEVYKIDKSFPLRFSTGALIFLYIVQYPALRLLNPNDLSITYSVGDWFIAYIFVICSSVVFLFFLYTGIGNGRVFVTKPIATKSAIRKLPIWKVFCIFLLFAAWSYLMVRLKIGMTIYADFDPLPFRLTGLLFYGRLLIQPFVLLYIAFSFQRSNKRWLVLLLLIALGAWVSLASGSRFIAIMFSLPILLLFRGRIKILFFFGATSLFITIATLARHFYLPFVIGGEYIEIYGNDVYQLAITDNLWMTPIAYLFSRTMGIGELLLTLSFGDITPNFIDAIQRLFSTFLPFIPQGVGVSIKNIYGLDDDVFGGFGLDLLSNYWIMYGGRVPTYLVGLGITSWLLGKIYRVFAVIFIKIGGAEYSTFLFVILFILFFEGRSHLFPYILIAGWIAGLPYPLQIYRSILSVFLGRRKRRIFADKGR